jgi:hypothetical protein
MSATITIPAIPADWISHTGIIPAGNGYRTHVRKVLHSSQSQYHPWVIHSAYVNDRGEWAYEQGDYCETLEEAKNKWANLM